MNTPINRYAGTTCAAVSTAHGKAGISVIRVSGDKSIAIVGKIFRLKSGKPLESCPSNGVVYGDLYYDGKVIDSGLCTVFRAPHSYTGEDTVEISCHGSELGTALILSSVLAAGAKPAGPGEFTKRAFLNGKLTLSQAEAVGELIDAENIASLRLSAAKIDGALARELTAITDEITRVLSSVYAVIDYPDEDLAELSEDEMRDKVQAILRRLHKLKDSYDTGRAITKGVASTIVGLPNSGKSSLLNALLGRERAIVTDVAGTTRDVLTESVLCGGVTLRLSDTAGLHDTDDKVEKIGVALAYEALNDAELVFLLLDGTTPPNDEEREALDRLLPLCGNKKVIVLISKKDEATFTKEKEVFAEQAFRRAGLQPAAMLSFSSHTGEGLEALKEAVNSLYPAGDELIRSGLVVTGARLYAAISAACEAAEDSLAALDTLTVDAAGMDLERALGALEEADGRKVSEEVVNSIFSHFCVGK